MQCYPHRVASWFEHFQLFKHRPARHHCADEQQQRAVKVPSKYTTRASHLAFLFPIPIHTQTTLLRAFYFFLRFFYKNLLSLTAHNNPTDTQPQHGRPQCRQAAHPARRRRQRHQKAAGLLRRRRVSIPTHTLHTTHIKHNTKTKHRPINS